MEMEKQAQAVKQQPIDNVDDLESMYKQIRDLDVGLLLSGLTILVKDTATYLTASGVDNEMAEAFRLAYLDMLNNNRDYWERFGPKLYSSLKEAGLPDGFASGAAQCDVNLIALTDGFWEKQEWLKAPGWHFFKTYSVQRKNDIFRDTTLKALKGAFCEGKSPYKPDTPVKQADEEKEPFKSVEAVVKRLAESDQQWTKFWYPVMLYMVVLLQKTNFMTLEDTL